MYRKFENIAKNNTVCAFKALLKYCLAGPLRDGLMLFLHKVLVSRFLYIIKISEDFAIFSTIWIYLLIWPIPEMKTKEIKTLI